MEVNEVLAAGEKVIARPPRSAERAIDTLIGNYIEHSLVYLSKEMWRQAMAISTIQPKSPLGETYAALDMSLAQQTSRLLEKLQSLDVLSSSVDIRSVGEVIFNNTNMNFIMFVKNEDMKMSELRVKLRQQHHAVLAGSESWPQGRSEHAEEEAQV
jgi:hypothetical protein